jgi:hypothetical protein
LENDIWKSIWKADTISKSTSGALFPNGMTCLPTFDNDHALDHFDLMIEKPKTVQQGHWTTKQGIHMVEKVELLAKSWQDGQMKKFGLIQKAKTQFDTSLSLAEESYGEGTGNQRLCHLEGQW